MKRAFVLSCLLALGGCGGASEGASPAMPPGGGRPNMPSPSPSPGDCVLSDSDRAMLDAVNAARASARSCGSTRYAAAPALRWSCPLAAAAHRHSTDMARHNFFSHRGSDGLQVGDRARAAGYAWRTVGENIAAGSSTLDAVMQGWLQSAGHCANIMNPNYQDLGAAVVTTTGSDYPIYWTQVFGRSQ